MARRGPMTRSPRPAPPMQRLSPGVYRSPQGGLVNSSGREIPRSNPSMGQSPMRQPSMNPTPIQGWQPGSNDAARMGKGPAIDPRMYQPVASMPPSPNFGQDFNSYYGNQLQIQAPQMPNFEQGNSPFTQPADMNFFRQPQPVGMQNPNMMRNSALAGAVAGGNFGQQMTPQDGQRTNMGFVPYNGNKGGY